MSEQEKFNVDAFHEQVLKAIDLIEFSENLQPGQSVPYSSGVEEFKKEAESTVQRPDMKKYICPALKTVTDNAVEVANAITPGLVAGVLAGTILIPLNPILFGWMALIIAKAGVASLCADL